jgi:hemoglobin
MGVPALVTERHDIVSLDDVALLVRRFYQLVIPDDLLGPIFHDMPVDWSVHIPKLIDFWASRLLGTPGYEGNPVGAHRPVLERFPFGERELGRWLSLWGETVDELFVGEVANLAKQRARMAASAIGVLSRRQLGASRRAALPVPARPRSARSPQGETAAVGGASTRSRTLGGASSTR